MIYSAGILAYKFIDNELYVLLSHPGGPYCEGKEYYCWSIPKGRIEKGETKKQAARREFNEETGFPAKGKLKRLGSVRMNSRKTVTVFAAHMDLDTSKAKSNTFIMEWPEKSGIFNEYPENDKSEWFHIKEAEERITHGQRDFISRLKHNLYYNDKK